MNQINLNNKEYDVIIVGAGFSGLYQLICLRDQLGMNCLVVETGDDVGGTWYWNRYPGARCDTESHAYSYYFSDELLNEWTWSERYPGHAEIRRYMNFVADKFDLKKDILFNNKVTSAQYNEDKICWKITTNNKINFKSKFLITAVGCLSNANIPNIRGLENFKGKYYHTGNWPKNDVSFVGKKVGQIGTGSTGIQAVPVIAEEAKHLTVFQRTANYSVPARNKPLTENFSQKTITVENFSSIVLSKSGITKIGSEKLNKVDDNNIYLEGKSYLENKEYKIYGTNISINLIEEVSNSDEPVKVLNSMGTLQAEGFKNLDYDGKIVFFGEVEFDIY